MAAEAGNAWMRAALVRRRGSEGPLWSTLLAAVGDGAGLRLHRNVAQRLGRPGGPVEGDVDGPGPAGSEADSIDCAERTQPSRSIESNSTRPLRRLRAHRGRR